VDGDGTHFSYYSAHGKKIPYVYFRADAYASYTTTPYAPPSPANPAKGTGTCKPYHTDVPAGGFANPLTFQIISAGQDGDWGGASDDKRFPSGLNYGVGDRDNITNFSEGTLGNQQG
jgi:hypothetical protein